MTGGGPMIMGQNGPVQSQQPLYYWDNNMGSAEQTPDSFATLGPTTPRQAHHSMSNGAMTGGYEGNEMNGPMSMGGAAPQSFGPPPTYQQVFF